jgi:hypothetical protein
VEGCRELEGWVRMGWMGWLSGEKLVLPFFGSSDGKQESRSEVVEVVEQW